MNSEGVHAFARYSRVDDEDCTVTRRHCEQFEPSSAESRSRLPSAREVEDLSESSQGPQAPVRHSGESGRLGRELDFGPVDSTTSKSCSKHLTLAQSVLRQHARWPLPRLVLVRLRPASTSTQHAHKNHQFPQLLLTSRPQRAMNSKARCAWTRRVN